MKEEEHVENGHLHELDDENMARLAVKAQAELKEIYERYGMPFLFSISILRQKEPQPNDELAEDAEVMGNLFGCAHCAPYFLAQAAMNNAHVAKLLADTIRWMAKFREKPDADIDDWETLTPAAGGKPM